MLNSQGLLIFSRTPKKTLFDSVWKPRLLSRRKENASLSLFSHSLNSNNGSDEWLIFSVTGLVNFSGFFRFFIEKRFGCAVERSVAASLKV